ncbi:MAG: hypothetical protein JST68_19640 [Bacteroidetes bacterium]|nr:hypothetical protein [Bacteroidota bacterium]
MIQERFDLTMGLIREKGGAFPFLQRLLYVFDSTVLVFSYFNKPSRGNARANILAAYVVRSSQRLKGAKVLGYPSLLANLRETRHKHICVSVFITEVGTFTVLSDFDCEEIIGSLFSPEAPDDVPLFSHLFMNGELLSRERE